MTKMIMKQMRLYLHKSLSGANKNKVNGLKAEAQFKRHLDTLGHAESITAGGWLFRTDARSGDFGSNNIALLPQQIDPNKDFSSIDNATEASGAIYHACLRLHSLGIKSYFCYPVINTGTGELNVDWYCKQLGTTQIRNVFHTLDQVGTENSFQKRTRRYNFLRYEKANIKLGYIAELSESDIPSVFSNENLRVAFQTMFFQEASDFDCIFFGQRKTYPVEIKEKTVANQPSVGDYFGIDLGPFVKLAFYANRSKDMNSLFVVREIDTEETRKEIAWWCISFEEMTNYASLVPQGGGTNMMGGGSVVVKIPKYAFHRMNKDYLDNL